jgi:signal transduction histidine kinase
MLLHHSGPEVERKGFSATDFGWHSWYWDTGLHLLFWRRDDAGNVIAVELNRARLIADLITRLGSTADDRGARLEVVDISGRVVHQWGGIADHGPTTTVELPLSAPLGGWRLRHVHGSADRAAPTAGFVRAVGLAVAAALLVVLAAVFYRESTRELRAARQRVGFVNQVSHELRTPLTNIRLYAELLEREMDDADEQSQEHLRVIVAECGRLSRLIGNVLTFARQQRQQLRLHRVTACLDETLRLVAEQYRPSLSAKGVEVVLDLGAEEWFDFDPDAVGQIVGNLLNNVEKYAAAGGHASVVSLQREKSAVVRVCDHGPGVPADRAEAVFEPFVRLSDRLTEGVSGTGLGLSIARQLARLHGGDLQLAASKRGACFELTLPLEVP